MRVLLDENIPRPFKKELPGHDVVTVREIRWEGVDSGELLARAEADFDLLITLDRNMQYQQNLSRLRRLAIIVLVSRSNRIEALQPLAPLLLSALNVARPGTITTVGSMPGGASPPSQER